MINDFKKLVNDGPLRVFLFRKMKKLYSILIHGVFPNTWSWGQSLIHFPITSISVSNFHVRRNALFKSNTEFLCITIKLEIKSQRFLENSCNQSVTSKSSFYSMFIVTCMKWMNHFIYICDVMKLNKLTVQSRFEFDAFSRKYSKKINGLNSRY